MFASNNAYILCIRVDVGTIIVGGKIVTERDIALCQKADAAVGEILKCRGVPPYGNHKYIPPESLARRVIYRCLLCGATGIFTGFIFQSLGKNGFVAAMISVIAFLAVSGLISELMNDADRELEARWLRIGKLFNSIWGATEWNVTSVESLRSQVLAHLEAQLQSGSDGKRLVLARCVVLSAAQIEKDLGFPLDVPLVGKAEVSDRSTEPHRVAG